MSEKNITFILHKPQLSENIGACARAIKNFNFKKLKLVSPEFNLNHEKIRPVCAGADIVIDKTRVYKNFDDVSGISFLPHSDHTYAQAPYQKITKEKYEELIKEMPQAIDWSRLIDFEKEDTTTGSKELACFAGVCEVVDIEAS